MNDRMKGAIALIGAVFLFLCTDATAKALVAHLGPMTQSYLRLFLGTILIGLFLRRFVDFRKLRQVSKKDILVIVVVGALGFGVKSALVAAGLNLTKLLNFTSIDSLTPLVVYVYSLMLLGTKFNLKILLATLISIYGVLVVSSKSLLPIGITIGQGEMIIIFSVLLNALGYIGRKLLSDKFNTFEISLYTMTLAWITLFTFAPVFGESFNVANLSLSLTVLLILGAICTTGASILMNYGVKRIEPVLVSQLLLTKVIFSLILGAIAFKEIPKGIELLGSMIILSGVYLANKFTFQSRM